jgi:histidinol-phosphate aminotransferase
MIFPTRIPEKPDGLLFDLDGVLADVSFSYRRAIIETAAHFGLVVTDDDIEQLKRAGDATNDWVLTYNLLVRKGVDVIYDDVVERFQMLYLGGGESTGLRESESLLVKPDLIPELAKKYPLALVTGRPRNEAFWFLERFELTPYFQTVVGMEDAPSKPDPEPVKRALCRLGVSSAWMIGDTPDDIHAAVSAGIPGIGISAPGMQGVLIESGASIVLPSADDLVDLLL